MKDPLSQIFLSRARSAVLSLLFDGRARSLHLREIARQSSLAIGTIQSEIEKLKALDLISTFADGNRLSIAANTNHPLYPELCGIVEKLSGHVPLLRSALAKHSVHCAFVFGSMAKGTAKAASDIDLVVIGDVSLRALSPALRKVSQKLDREINPHVYSVENWRNKVARHDHFVSSILDEETVFIVGDENVLTDLG